ncbi:hypothetical protein GCM10012280_70170 [Wenjunlia tyrosinilytica]|uniref:Uncharacterized protein n=1 Tax=Wenjunlia tyrosinilytica TaxID=1544741 RepID=A0A917ZYW0_9ACTN|nr:hypothetical protein GCM10012280_70170 [Wenjunlia tyrosinilytica]
MGTYDRAVPPKTKPFAFPESLLELQRHFFAAERELSELYASLPTGTEHWPEGAQDRVNGLLEQQRQLAERIQGDEHWASVPTEDLVEARSDLKQQAE